MISPRTAPGTLVAFRPVSQGWPIYAEAAGLTVGSVYRLDAIQPLDSDIGGFGCRLVETAAYHAPHYTGTWVVSFIFPIVDFELAVLPRCLAEIVERAPVDEREMAEIVT